MSNKPSNKVAATLFTLKPSIGILVTAKRRAIEQVMEARLQAAARHAFLAKDQKSLLEAIRSLREMDTPNARRKADYYDSLWLQRAGHRSGAIRMLESLAGSDSDVALLSFQSLAVNFAVGGEIAKAANCIKLLLCRLDQSEEYDPFLLMMARWELAILASIDGDHASSLDTLRQLAPLVSAASKTEPYFHCAYADALALEYLAVGEIEAAQHFSDIALRSPISRSYAEPRETALKLERATHRSRYISVPPRQKDAESFASLAPIPFPVAVDKEASNAEDDTDQARCEMSARMHSPHATASRLRRAIAAFDAEAERWMDDETEILESRSASQICWRTDVNGRCLWVSQSWLDFTGKTRAEAHGKSWLAETLTRKDLMAVATKILEATAKREAFVVEYRARDHSGKVYKATDLGVPLTRSGQFVGFMGFTLIGELIGGALTRTGGE